MEGRLPGCFTEDRTAYAAAEIAKLRQELTAFKACIQQTGRHNATEAYKDNAFKRFTPWKADRAKSAPMLDDVRERMAALCATGIIPSGRG
jgi:hypothetical protein